LKSAAIGLVCLNGLALLPAANAQPLPASRRRITTFAYEPAPERGMPLVRVRVNNGAHNEIMATFVIDTGFTDCMMSDRLARLLQMAGEPALREDGTPACFADGRPLKQVMPSVQVGSFLTDQCRFMLLKAYRLDLLDCPLDGVLGWYFLADHAVLFDFQAHRITLWHGGDLSVDEIGAAGMQDAILLPRANDTPGRFDVRVRLDDQLDVTLSIDTGGAHTLIAPASARLLELEPTRTGFKQPSIFGEISTNEARLHSLSFGNQRVTDIPVRYLQQEHPNLPPHLGLDVLHNYRMLIDYPAHKLYLKPIATPSLPKK
jgi:predicted aspartyl protease